MTLRTVLGILLIINGYVLVYYRLMVRHYYETHYQTKESTFGTLFSFPPYRALPEPGKRYARRYWVAVVVMVAILGVVAWQSNFSVASKL